MSVLDNHQYKLAYAQKRLAELDLYEFVLQGWPILEPEEFIPGWHLKAICDHLQAVYEGRIKRLIINIPPGCAKSLLCSVFYPAWVWIRDPGERFLTGSHGVELSMRDTVRSRLIMTSEWYQKNWGDNFCFSQDQNQKSFYYNDKNGWRLAFSTRSGITGKRGSTIILDDPLNFDDSFSENERRRLNRWLGGGMITRLNSRKHGKIILVMQRLNEEDPTGFLLKQGGWEHLCLPMEFESERRCVTSIFTDPREKEGEILWAGEDEESLASYKKSLGSYATAGQLQQRPAPIEGGLIKNAWWKYYSSLPPNFDIILQSWDTAVEINDRNNYSVCTTWGILNNKAYLIDLTRKKLEYPELKRCVYAMGDKYRPDIIKVEKKQSGQQIIQELKRESNYNIEAVEPGKKSKEARALAVTPIIERGDVYLPEHAVWLMDFLDEMSYFPNGAHDDIVDSVAQALNYIVDDREPRITVV